ncbi:MAG: type III-B CRISPR module RAMP protein Cmr4 [Bacillota bacterium]|nr:type III-B CRISPR module RAMP protein Cmr4 [Bacillota bacterium]
MSDNTRVYWVHALTPLHVGAGRGAAFVDLPVMREKVTGWPLVPGTAMKGVLRDMFERDEGNKQFVDAAFGRAAENTEDDQAGALVLTDARLVLLPVRSYFGTFVYATSSLALQRLARDLEQAEVPGVPSVPDAPAGERALVAEAEAISEDGRMFLEDLDFATAEDPSASAWARFLAGQIFPDRPQDQKMLLPRFAILSDSTFDFLSETGTEVQARIRIDDKTKTVAGGALWYEESLPPETVLAGLVWCDRVWAEGFSAQEVLDKACGRPLICQVGGKATTGRGRVRCLFSGKEV